jgi:hypothetical protein
MAATAASFLVAVLFFGVKLTEKVSAGMPFPQPKGVSGAPIHPPSVTAPASFGADAALAYARAYQDGDCDAVVAATGWMQQRLAWARSQDKSLTVDDVRKQLCDRIASGRDERNCLRPEGIEDAQVFLPGARVEVLRVDRGRADLSETVAQRVWLKVRYANPESAPRDQTGHAIVSLVAGLNFSPEGRVVKAGVIGSLELDPSSISIEWDTQEEV